MVVIFDVGNVLINTSFSRVMDALSINAPFTKDSSYFSFTKGLITPMQYYRHFIEKYGLDISYVVFCNAWDEFFLEEVFGAKDLLRKISDGNKLYVLSNSNILHALSSQRRFSDLFSYFSCFFYSFNIRYRKPEREIYEELMNIINITQVPIIFIDDKPENIEAAKKLNIDGILFKGMDDLFCKINEY